MSISISALQSNTPDYVSDRDASTAKPTVAQQMHTLATSGQSAQQIASTLSLPISQVDSALGIASSTNTASALVAATARFSVRA